MPFWSSGSSGTSPKSTKSDPIQSDSTESHPGADSGVHPSSFSSQIPVDSQELASSKNSSVSQSFQNLASAFSLPRVPHSVDLSADEAIARFEINSPSDRLSIHPAWRIIFGTSTAALVGFALGASHGGVMAGYRFRAENAHRLPKSQKGWFFYHKTKNYHAALGGIKEGIRMGAKLGFWAGGFLIAETAVDSLRRGDGKDVFSTVVAAAGTSGAWSVWNRFSIHTWARTTKIGLLAGFGYGMAQDALGVLRGRRIGYVERIKATFGISSNDSGASTSSAEGTFGDEAAS